MKRKRWNLAVVLFAFFLVGCTAPLFSGGGSEEPDGVVNTTDEGYAVEGADVVAFFSLDTDADAVMGSDSYTYQWKGAVWLFSNQSNLEAFQANPQMYAPRYGGYCAYAMARDYIAAIDPDAWTITDGKLYLNYSKSIRSKWLKDLSGEIQRADENWPEWDTKLSAE